ncbi:Uncharacterised protein [Legionella wadsworthii]|uniref:Uncharacterized protein n=1 Tax=Legionella wadsworthii TaxID=28088 RepID=A0A378LRY5_9GAMM|nr:hypothetical protein [Legionella wadsworthii]STY29716.1 Uncharacterised protein [Legionella wadsworthii]
MSDFKSKLPDLKELASMTNKLFTDIKKSVGEIVHNYKENRAQETEAEQKSTTPPQAGPKEQTIVEETIIVKEKPKSAKASEPTETVETIETIEVVETVEPSKKPKTEEDTKK